MTQLDLESLLTQQTKEEIYETALEVAQGIGLDTTTWQPGDPTRSLYHVEAEFLSVVEDLANNFVRSGFLEHALGDWLKVVADQVYNVTVPEATFATTDVELTNSGGGLYEGADTEAGALIFRNSTTGKTYTNTTGGTLAVGPGTTLTVTVVADEAGTDSNAAVGEIDELVTNLTGVTCTNAAAAVGTDEQDRATTIQQCRDALGMLSPNGAKDAYSYVARNSELTGTTAITDSRVFADSDTGDVTVYLRGAAGAVLEVDRALVEEAILTYATPLCITPTVVSCAAVTVPVTYSLKVYKSANKTVAEIEEEVEEALEALFAARPIGGDIIPPATTGYLYRSLIVSTILGLYGDDAFDVEVTTPSDDTALANDEVPSIGTVTAAITIVRDPY
jgi:hypothetical protein